jgi:isopenicillin-N epimerase
MGSFAEPLMSRDRWLLDPDVTFLNHGSFGAVPRQVLEQQRRLQERMERNPTRFLTYELPDALRASAERLAGFLGGNGRDYVFTENATAGCNTVMNSVPFGRDDEILVTDHCYPAVLLAAQQVAKKNGATIVQAEVPFPLVEDAQIIRAVEAKLSRRTRLVILDHITSPTALVFPVDRLTARCRDVGAQVLIDGAHAPGMLSLDLPSIRADWYVGNCHKWLMAPKGSAFIWVSPERQAEIHPLVISHGSGKGLNHEFDWIGTRDPTAWLSVSAAIDWHLQAGGRSLSERNATLVETAAQELAGRWKSEMGAPANATVSMKAVRLPFGEPTHEAAQRLRAVLFRDHRLDTAIVVFANSLWIRLSAQAYNSLPEYLRLGEIIGAYQRAEKTH